MKNYKLIYFRLDRDKIKLKFIKDPKKVFIASSSQLGIFKIGYISVDKLFFNDFTKKQQKAIIYHELWHYNNNLKFEIKVLFSKKFWIFFLHNKLGKLQEFEADRYSAKKNKKDILSTLKKIKNFVKNNRVEYNFNNHPSIEERIKRINEIK